MTLDLPLIWAFIIAFAVFAYVVMDGFDLGIGLLFPWFEAGEERDMAMNSIAPVWDGNETWLVLGAGGLFAAFPTAYAIIFPATYPLMIAMLLGLIFRGVAFEFRWRDPGHRKYWDAAFAGGSFVAALTQGMTLGALLQGIEVKDAAYAGGWLDWLSPFSILTGVSLVAGYGLLGVCWLIWKTEGAARNRARRFAPGLGLATLAALGGVSLATPFLNYAYWHRWFDFPGLILTATVPVLVALCALIFLRALRRNDDRTPFLSALTIFLLGFAGLGVSMYPYIVPESVTIWEAAAPESSQLFMLIGTAVIIPIILIYTGWAYWVFRGKVGPHGYH